MIWKLDYGGREGGEGVNYELYSEISVRPCW